MGPSAVMSHVLDVTRVHPVACMPDGALNCFVLGDRHRDRSHRLHERDPFELGYHARSTGSTLITDKELRNFVSLVTTGHWEQRRQH